MAIVMFATVTFVALTIFVVANHVEPATYMAGRRGSTAPSSPVDEAERILAKRYARGEISPEQFDRMLVILRR